MTTQEYEKLEKTLLEKGYRKTTGIIHNSDWYFYKCIIRDKDKDGDSRAVCQVLYAIYDMRKYVDKGAPAYGIEKIVNISSTVDERTEFLFSKEMDCDTFETLAKKAYEFVTSTPELC